MRFQLSCPPSQLDATSTVPSGLWRRTRRQSRRGALAILSLAIAALVPTTSAVFITVPAGTAGQVIPTGGWTSGTFSTSGKVNGTDSSICQPGSTTVTSSRATDKLGFSFIGTAIQVITTSGPQGGFYQATLDGTSSTVAIFSSQDSCGASFGAKELPAGPHTIDVMLLQAGAVDVIAFRYDDGKIATSASSSGTAGPSGTGTPPAPGGSNTTAIIGGVVGGVLVGLALAALASWLFLRHRKRNAAAADRDSHQLLAAPYGAPSIATTQGSGGGASGIGYNSGTYATQSTPSSRSNQNPSYYNNATSYYPSEAGWTGGPPGGYPTSNSTASGGPRALHEEDLERIAAHVAAMVSPAVRASNYRSDDQDEHSGGGRSSLSYNGPEPTPTSSAPTQRTAKAEYIRSQQRPDAPGVTRAPDAREGTYPPSRNRKGGPQGPPEEPPPAY